MKTWTKSDLLGLFFAIFGVICLIFSASNTLASIFLLLSTVVLLRCVYNSRYDLLKYRNVLCHYQAVLASSQDGWLAWNIDNEYVGSSKRLRNFFNIKHSSPIIMDDILCSIDKNSSEELSFHFNKLKKTGMTFKIAATTADGKNQIEIVGSRAIVNNIETILLWCSDITRSSSMMASIEQKLQTEYLRAESMSEILDALPIPVWKRNAELEIIYCNKTYAEWIDSSIERVIIGNSPLIPGNLFGQGHSLAENAKKCNRTQVIAQPIVVKGVRKKLSVFECPASKGNFLGYALDISAEENTAANLDKIVTANCEVLENLSTAIAIFGENTRLLFFNSAYQRLTKAEAGWLYSKPTYSEILDEQRNNRQLPEHADFQAFKRSQMAMFTSITSPLQELMHLPNGKTLRVVTAPYPLGGLLFMYEDVTDSLALQRKNNTLMAVQKETIDHLYEGIAVYGSDNRLKIFNNAAKKIWSLEGFSDKEMKGMHLSELLDNIKTKIDFGDSWNTFRASAISNLTDRIYKTGKLMKNDNSVILFSYIPLPDGAHMLSYIDVTDTCMVERAITEKNEALQSAQKLRFEFVYGISTELNEPLNTLVGFAELLVHQYFGALNEKQLEYSKYILAAANQLYQLMNNLLEMVSIDIDSTKLNISTFSVEETLKEVLTNVEKRVNEKNIEVTSNFDQSKILFDGDKLRIKQAVFNVMINAIQSTPIKGKIDVRVTSDENSIKIIIKDGCFSHTKKDRKKFFKRSKNVMAFRSSETENVSMPLVRTLVELHGGTFSVSSDVDDGGTCAVISLPISKHATDIATGTPEQTDDSEESKDNVVLEFKKVVNS